MINYLIGFITRIWQPEGKQTFRGGQNRLLDNLSVYTTELVAILLALEWVEGNELNNSVIISDSYSALESIKTGKSIRNDIIHQICMVLYKLNAKDLKIRFLWAPAHVGVKGNEEVDRLAKQTLKHNRILQVPYSKSEAKTFIKAYARSKWQEYWVDQDKGRHLYNIQPEVDRKDRV